MTKADRNDILAAEYLRLHTLHPIDDWHEEIGDVIWWHLPVCEPPIIGSPMQSDWGEGWPEDWHTHWSHLPNPKWMGLPGDSEERREIFAEAAAMAAAKRGANHG